MTETLGWVVVSLVWLMAIAQWITYYRAVRAAEKLRKAVIESNEGLRELYYTANPDGCYGCFLEESVRADGPYSVIRPEDEHCCEKGKLHAEH